MSRYPGAIWKPIEAQYLSGLRMAAYNRVNLHVAVSEASSLHGFFNAKGRASSHFYVRKDGTVEQYVDTAYRAEADLDGNDATISVETQGGVSKPQQEPWTGAQVAALADLFAWAVTVHGIEPRLAKDSKPGESSKGLSWHRLGIDPWRVDGGMRYSLARGKVCPGDAKIAQIPTILSLALGGTNNQEDEVSVDDVRVGFHGLLKEAAERSTPTGKQVGDYLVRIIDPLVTKRVADVVDEKALVEALVKSLPAGTGGLTASDVRAAARRAVEDVFKRAGGSS